MRQMIEARRERIVGRDSELELLERFAYAQDGPAALELVGEPGVGKTTLWEAGAEAAGEKGVRVLSARPTDTETGLSFGALADLLEGVDIGALVGVPNPQRRALETALLRIEPSDSPPDAFAISAGFLSTLRALAEQDTVLMAVDDVPWLDQPSADALAYAARRLRGHPVRFLLARRPGDPAGLERALERLGLETLAVGPLSLGATRALLSGRLGLTLPRRVLQQVHAAGEGNPLFTLELGRMLAQRGLPEIGEELPVPDAVEDLLGTRVARLRGPVRTVLLAVALSADLRLPDLTELGYGAAIDRAVDAGLLALDGDRVRASHPLLAAAARKHSSSRTRRALHTQLARVVADEGLRTRHLVLAAQGPDEELAAAAARAAAAAAARGAAHEAVELGEGSLRLTPPDSAERVDRLLEVASHLAVAGEQQRLTDLLAPELDSLPAGAARVSAWLLLAGGIADDGEAQRYLEQALADSGRDTHLRAAVLGEIANNSVGVRVERIREAEQWALEAVAGAGDAEVERTALHGLAWARALRGRAIDDLCERSRAASPAAALLTHVPERVAVQRLVWRGELDRARASVTGMQSLAEEHGQAVSRALLRLHLCELELRGGGWDAASALLEGWENPLERELLQWPMYERCRALTAAGRGSIDDTERWAAEAIARAEEAEVVWDRLEALRARAIAALLAHDAEAAAESLRLVWVHTCREGVDEPGVFPVAPDLVEALVELGELSEAREVTERLGRLSREQAHPWGSATARRCEGLIGLASGYDDRAAALLLEAAESYGQLGLRFDQARSLLVLGRAQRRFKKWGAARRSLERALAAFDEMGSPGRAEEAASELARVGARRRAEHGVLTPADERVAGLAADGLSNKEIAARLFVSVNTVERHLSHAYAKLGVTSRAKLTQRLLAGDTTPRRP